MQVSLAESNESLATVGASYLSKAKTRVTTPQIKLDGLQ